MPQLVDRFARIASHGRPCRWGSGDCQTSHASMGRQQVTDSTLNRQCMDRAIGEGGIPVIVSCEPWFARHVVAVSQWPRTLEDRTTNSKRRKSSGKSNYPASRGKGIAGGRGPSTRDFGAGAGAAIGTFCGGFGHRGALEAATLPAHGVQCSLA
jgi:hypothetical protein